MSPWRFPFTTIAAGITAAGSLSGIRTVHVAGGTVPVVYSEASSILVTHNLILLGDGAAKTTISASGPCASSSGTCGVSIEGGGTLDGFTVISSRGDGILTLSSSPPPIVKNVAADGSKLSGITVLGSVELGPNLSASRNGLQGVFSTGGGIVHVNAPSVGGVNAFDLNAANGIDVEGNALLRFEGGTANGNSFNGVRLSWTAGTPGAGPSHTITGLTATGNKNTGIAAFNGQNLKLRASKLQTNNNYGMFYGFVGTSALDLGTLADLGGNILGGATARNGKAGIYLCKSRGSGTEPAEGNTWPNCGPNQQSLSLCDATPSSYVDVAYVPAISGDPVVASTCTVGP